MSYGVAPFAPAWASDDQDRTSYHYAMLRLARPVLLLAVFLVPYVTWRVVPGYLFTISDAFFCIAAVLLLAGRDFAICPLREWWPIWIFGLSALLIGFFIGSIVNGDPIRWIIVAGQYGFAFAVLPSLMLRDNRASLAPLALALVAGVTAMELFGTIVYYATGGSHDVASRFSFEFITGAHRLGAFMADANWNAAMVALTVPFVLYLARIGVIRLPLALPILAALVSGLILSGSFTGFVSTILAALLFFFIDWGKRSMATLLGLVAMGTGALSTGIALPPAFQNRVANAFENGDINQAGTFTGRMELIKEAWNMVGDTSFVGLGVDQYRVISAVKAPVHNMYLLAWAEGGLLSLIGWVLLLFVPIAVIMRSFAINRSASALVAAVFTPFVIFSNASPHMYSRSWTVPLILAIGIALMQSAQPPQSSAPSDQA